METGASGGGAIAELHEYGRQHKHEPAAEVHAASKWRPQCHALRRRQRDFALGRALTPVETAYGQLYREVRV